MCEDMGRGLVVQHVEMLGSDLATNELVVQQQVRIGDVVQQVVQLVRVVEYGSKCGERIFVSGGCLIVDSPVKMLTMVLITISFMYPELKLYFC